MEDHIKEIEQRLRQLEGYNKLIIGGGTVLAICSLAFLGFEYSRIPGAVRAAADAKIDHELIRKIKDAGMAADALLVNLKNQSGFESTSEHGERGFAYFGDTLMCWGHRDLPAARQAGVREFDFTFIKEFAEPPIINEGISAKGSGHTFGVYRYDLTTKTYKGAVFKDDNSGANQIPVRMSYIAIGKPKP